MDFSALKEMKPLSQLLFAIFIMVSSVFLFMLVGILLALPFYGVEGLMKVLSEQGVDTPEKINFMKYLQVLQSIGLFVAPPFAIARLYHGNIGDYLMANRLGKPKHFVLAAICVLTFIPFINFLGEINGKMSFPAQLADLEKWMKDMEEAASLLIDKFMLANTFTGLIFNIFMIAILPALGEELMFRGVVQRIFSGWTKNYHWGIWITAFLFSAMHMQFYGFLPRMLLGGVFGYLLVWSGTIWVPILAHFTNNLIGVLGYYYTNNGLLPKDIEQIGAGEGQMPLALGSLAIACFLLYLIFREKQTETKMPVNRSDSQA